MGEFTIKLNDPKLLEALSEMASAHGQPIETEVHALLRSAIEEHARRRELLRRADSIAAMTPSGIIPRDSVDIIREMREERDRALGG